MFIIASNVGTFYEGGPGGWTFLISDAKTWKTRAGAQRFLDAKLSAKGIKVLEVK